MNRRVDVPIEVLSVYSISERIRYSGRIHGACASIGDPGTATPDGLRERVDFLLELRFHDIVARD